MYYKSSEESAEADCRRKWRIWSPADVLNVWPAYQHPLSPDMHVPGRGTVWSFERVARTIRLWFWSLFKRVRKENDICQQLNCPYKFHLTCRLWARHSRCTCCWRLYMDVGICCLMRCSQKSVYCSNDYGIQISIWHNIVQYKSSHIPEWAAMEELGRYLLFSISSCARTVAHQMRLMTVL